jgi:hypothetical protein
MAASYRSLGLISLVIFDAFGRGYPLANLPDARVGWRGSFVFFLFANDQIKPAPNHLRPAQFRVEFNHALYRVNLVPPRPEAPGLLFEFASHSMMLVGFMCNMMH